jgi:allantoate deiminase
MPSLLLCLCAAYHGTTPPREVAEWAAMQAARRVLERADELAACTAEPGRITRPVATPAMADALARVRAWMEAAGLETRSDPLGNLAGRRGTGPPLVIGSHLDSVADAGRYDGVLGVLVGIEVAAACEVPLEVVAFADEDGLRFRSSFLGSRAYLGRLTAADLALRDGDGISLAEALGVREPWPAIAPPDIRAYYEVHIEQGPVLDAAGLPLGVVTAIAGQTSATVAFAGRAGHAGTTPMDRRRDALAAAAEFVLAAERAAHSTPGLVATVGRLDVPRGASNVVPGRAELTLDVRHAEDTVRERAIAALRERTEKIAVRREVGVEWEQRAVPATPCSLVAPLRRAVEAVGAPVRELVSGAGHDAMIMAGVTDVGMLFVRCAGGISHHPDEAVREDDVALAIAATVRACTT